MSERPALPHRELRVAARLRRGWDWLARHTPRLIAGASLGALAVGVAVSWPHLRAYSWDITWWPLAVAALAYPPAQLLAATLWGAILERSGGRASWRQHLKVYCASCLARRLPTPAWFIAGRLGMYRALGVGQRMTSVAMALEVALIAFSGAVVSLAALLLPDSLVGLPARYTPWLAGLAVASLLLVARPTVLPRVMTAIGRRLGRQQQWDVTVDPGHMLLWAGGYALIWVLGGITLYCLTRALHPLPIARLPHVIGIWALAGTISQLAVFMPAGLGIREASLVAMLSTLAPLPVVVVVAIVARLWYSILELVFFALTSRLHLEEPLANESPSIAQMGD